MTKKIRVILIFCSCLLLLRCSSRPRYCTYTLIFDEPYQVGVASYYAEKFHGRPTASGEIFDMHKISAAHKTLPLGTMVRVTNLENNKSIIVKINDRGPYKKGRIIDLSYEAAKKLEMIEPGTVKVKVELVE